ncbi:MAG: hypothetical protein ACJAWM_001996 [Sulfitobacter sp.]|jgi:hypothetical protein
MVDLRQAQVTRAACRTSLLRSFHRKLDQLWRFQGSSEKPWWMFVFCASSQNK